MFVPVRLLVVLLLIGSLATGTDAADSAASNKVLAQDRLLQGEYVGTLADGTRWGAQVIARGELRFRGVGFRGGLPGDGWQPGDEMRTAEAICVGNAIEFGEPDQRIVVREGSVFVHGAQGVVEGELKKVVRTSPTLGAKPPASATVLFDGTSTQGWNNGQVHEVEGEKLLMSTDCDTLEKFGDHQLHLEFRTPLLPEVRGQGRGNSGVFVQSRYEVQILDSFGLSGEHDECGAIYKIQKPAVNMCFPPEGWQTLDIDFQSGRYDASDKLLTNARITVRHNGVVIHDNLELTRGTPGRLPVGGSAEPVYLQDHQNPVLFRNIWAVKR
ncbi:MAG: DUF1080 domain-containing protein [Planctomycetota bacterium]|nr:DUF1080 domain-containing protein [Planctomycetota bacterium]MDA1177549.1 DUF1080 domain-containing protein [Planctomycetota bacterium]